MRDRGWVASRHRQQRRETAIGGRVAGRGWAMALVVAMVSEGPAQGPIAQACGRRATRRILREADRARFRVSVLGGVVGSGAGGAGAEASSSHHHDRRGGGWWSESVSGMGGPMPFPWAVSPLRRDSNGDVSMDDEGMYEDAS